MSDVITENELLHNVSEYLSKVENSNKETGNSVNIFKIAKIETDEVITCRILAFLLNPNEKHYQGKKFLNLFLNEIGEKKFSENDNVKVYTEYPTNENRRIDIVIESKELKRFLPFEVKIGASDQEKQCIHYFKFSKQFGADKVFYLTPDEHEPSESSKGDGELISGENLKLLSFRKHILNWLDACEKEKLNEPLKELIREFKSAIKSFCHILENKEMQEEIFNEIIKSEESKQAALAIANIITIVSNTDCIWKMFFHETEKHFIVSYGTKASGTSDAITLYLNDDIQIDFQNLFRYIFIACGDENIRNLIKKTFQEKGYACSEPNAQGFAVNNVDTHFLGCDKNDKLAVYERFTKHSNEIIEKMRDFVSIISEVI